MKLSSVHLVAPIWGESWLRAAGEEAARKTVEWGGPYCEAVISIEATDDWILIRYFRKASEIEVIEIPKSMVLGRVRAKEEL